MLLVYLVTSDSWDFMDCSAPSSSIHGISQARVLECIGTTYSRASSWPRNRIHVSRTGRWILYHRATWEVSWAYYTVSNTPFLWRNIWHQWKARAESGGLISTAGLCMQNGWTCVSAIGQKHFWNDKSIRYLWPTVQCLIHEYHNFLLCEDGKYLPTMNPAKFWAENISDLFVTSGTNFMVIKSQTIYLLTF